MGKVHTEYGDGARFYVADDSPDVFVPGVTSILNMIPKGFLSPWYAKLAAEKAVDATREGWFIPMAQSDPKGAVNFIKGAAPSYSKGRAAIGSEAHNWFERIIRGEAAPSLADLDDDLSAEAKAEVMRMVGHFQEFLDEVQPELVDAENVAWSDMHGYAGSFDAILRFGYNPETKKADPEGDKITVMGDWKTGKTTYPDVALQLAAYSFADRIIDAEGVSKPMVKVDGAAVLHVTKDQWAFKSVRVDEEVFEVFTDLLHGFKAVQRWNAGKGSIDKSVLGKPLAKSARRITTGTERRAK